MRKALLLITLLAVNLTAGSADNEMSMDLMQNIEDVNKSLSSNIALANKQGAGDDAKELTRMFAQVEAHFVQKGDEAKNATELAKQSKDLSAEIGTLVAAGKFEPATDKATTLSRTCRTCHTFYKKE